MSFNLSFMNLLPSFRRIDVRHYPKSTPIRLWILSLFCLLPPLILGGQSASIKPPHFRGLVVTKQNDIWISGTRGSILKGHFNANQQLQFDTCESGYPRKDFRDIWALDAKTAVAMSIADSAVVIKTSDGGKTWRTTYHDETPGIFLDVIEIDPSTGVGMILGDPLQGHFKALFTTDYGSSWIEIPASDWNVPLDTLESFFAASGTSLSIIASKAPRSVGSQQKKKKFSLTAGFAGGGHNPQFHLVQIDYRPPINPPHSASSPGAKKNTESTHDSDHETWNIRSLPTHDLHMKGGPAWGCYGLTTYQMTKGIAVGGNYAQPSFRGDSSGVIAAYTNDILGPWKAAATPPYGYRSGVCVSAGINKDTLFQLFFRDQNNLCETFYKAHGEFPHNFFYQTNHTKEIPLTICTGTSGTDISFDGGIHWLQLSKERGFNACAWSCDRLILAGNLGKVHSISIREISEMFQHLNPSSPSR